MIRPQATQSLLCREILLSWLEGTGMKAFSVTKSDKTTGPNGGQRFELSRFQKLTRSLEVLGSVGLLFGCFLPILAVPGRDKRRPTGVTSTGS